MNWPAGFEHCRSCVHADDMDTDYDYCHVCIMEHDCYKPKEDTMQSEQEVTSKPIDDFRKEIPSIENWLRSRGKGIWRNGYQHGYEQGVEIGKADVQNKLEVIDEIKQGEYNRGYNECLAATMCDDTAIKYLHLSGWLPEHDRIITEASFRKGRDYERENPFFSEEASKILHDREEEAYNKGFNAGQLVPRPVDDENYNLGFKAGMDTAWDVARKLRHPSYSGVFQEERKEIFGYENADDVLTNLSAAEALLAVHEYGKRKAEKESGKPEKPDLKVGDCVLDGSGNFCTITQIGTHIHVMYPSGKTHKWSKGAKFRYVGRSFNTDLEAMKHKMEQAAP